MAIIIKDSKIDRDLEVIMNYINTNFGIKCSKVDAIRFLLNQKKQGKKTDRRWKKVFV